MEYNKNSIIKQKLLVVEEKLKLLNMKDSQHEKTLNTYRDQQNNMIREFIDDVRKIDEQREIKELLQV
jgi:hypothetical protein